jgi:DNA-binding GntR family transcriptional regulator
MAITKATPLRPRLWPRAHVPAEMAALEQLIAEGAAAARRGDPLGNAECNQRFHAGIIRAARHRLLDRMWQMLAPQQWLLMPAGAPPVSEADIAAWEAQHRFVLQAIQHGDPETAERAARAHVAASAARPLRRARLTSQSSRRDDGSE